MLLLCCLPVSAQRFFNLTAQEVKIDSLLPVFTYRMPLGYHYQDSVYSISIKYPEFIDMSEADARRCRQLMAEAPGAFPAVSQVVSVDRRQGELVAQFVPLVCRDGRYQKLVSFMIDVTASPAPVRTHSEIPGGSTPLGAPSRAGRATAADLYAGHSVLASGRWVKIRVPQTGVYQLTADVVRQAGFTDVSKVRIYGYGGALQPEQLTADYLAATDDLKEVPTCEVGGRRLFHAVGPVTWNANNVRVRNPYSNYGYYFLTQDEETPLTVDQETFLASFYPSADYRNTLYEVDDYAWYHGGRNLYDSREIGPGGSRSYTIAANSNTQSGWVTVALSGKNSSSTPLAAEIAVNGIKVGTINVSAVGSYDAMRTATQTFQVSLQSTNTVTVSHVGGDANSLLRLDYISLRSVEMADAPNLASADFPAPEVVYGITNQDHHADAFADMVIIIPTTQKLLAQAERLKTLHEQRDGLRVRIVPADELFNEFSSGTPDATAYRRYLKMLYDRADTDADMPKYLLLMGDGAWDNRMASNMWKGYSPDDFLLCYESENSYSATDCYVSDDYFGLMDDGEGSDMRYDKSDVAVGRISARTADEAAVVVDKIIDYVANGHGGDWQNTLCFMGDDGNHNDHMEDADSVAKMVEQLYPTYMVKRIMWDAYTRVSSATGNRYPDVTRLIKQQMQSGALIMDYAGHGRADAMSHEYAMVIGDFLNTSANLPLWMTASCDIMPFDGQEDNIGETAMFNPKGGSVAFFGTTRTVYQMHNKLMNVAFTRHVLSREADGQLLPIGEAVRRAKNELIETGIQTGYNDEGNPVYSTDRTLNKLQYSLLGDPALRLAAPTQAVVVDAVNGQQLSDGQQQVLSTGSKVTVSGHIETLDGTEDTAFDGLVTTVVRDALQQIVCKMNDPSETTTPFVFYDRPNTIFRGVNEVKGGRFTVTFAVPRDISYSDLPGLLNLYAISNDKTRKASGICSQVQFAGADTDLSDNMGPSIYCYLNSSSFTNGGDVNPTPYFVAQLSDEDGINATGSSIGHDLELIIDGDMSKTYSLNEYFQYDFGSYTSGTVGFSIPQLDYGPHRLLFRAWDVMNNSSSTELAFNVVKGLEPRFFDVECTRNPASTSTEFRILHDRVGSQMDVVLDVLDMSGRLLWSHAESGVSTDNPYTISWDLTVDGGRRLQTGVYLYRVRISSDGSSYASKAKKLIVLTNR